MAFRSLGVSDEKSAWLRDELARDEEVLWSGEPTPRFFTAATLPAFLFSIPWTGFAIFWVVMAFAMSGAAAGPVGIVFPLFGLPFVAVGLFMMSAPWWARRRLARAVYAVTDRRALVIDHDFRDTRCVQSYGPAEITTVEKRVRPDGSGDVLFADKTQRGRHGREYSVRVGFVGVREARKVEQALAGLASQKSHAIRSDEDR